MLVGWFRSLCLGTINLIIIPENEGFFKSVDCLVSSRPLTYSLFLLE